MPRILAYTSPAKGHLFPLTPILDALVERGHEVHLRTLASEVPRMNARGVQTAAIDARIEACVMGDWRARSPQQALSLAVRTFCDRAPHDAADLQRAIADVRPDMVVVDINCWGAMAAAEAWGGAWATFSPYPLALRSRDVPPFGPGLPPARGPLGRLRDALLRPIVVGAVSRIIVPACNAVRAPLGVAPIASPDELFLRPPLLLYMTAEPFEYPRHDWPANVVMIGPCAWEPPSATPDWLEQITRPIVLVTTSSEFQDDGRLVAVALEALRDEPVHVVATVPAGDPVQFTVPDNATVVSFVPHSQLLPRAVCAITHGGMGATQKALAHGVPVCAVPFGRDQLEVARRVEICGAGTRLAASALRPDRLRGAVREAMARKAGAMRVASAFRDAGGASAAVTAIEQHLRTR
jgi:MGT family glycosyltransferase